MARIFVAVPVDEAVGKVLAQLPRQQNRRWRWVKPEHYHITLKFLGEIDAGQIPLVGEAVQQAAAVQPGPLPLVARGLGAFPRQAHARVLWAGIQAGAAGLVRLQAAVEQELAARGFPRDRRPFKPHITLARTRRAGPWPDFCRDYENEPFGSWQVQTLQVIQSRLTPAGPRYTVRHEISLT